jgi:hypothetical protein
MRVVNWSLGGCCVWETSERERENDSGARKEAWCKERRVKNITQSEEMSMNMLLTSPQRIHLMTLPAYIICALPSAPSPLPRLLFSTTPWGIVTLLYPPPQIMLHYFLSKQIASHFQESDVASTKKNVSGEGGGGERRIAEVNSIMRKRNEEEGALASQRTRPAALKRTTRCRRVCIKHPPLLIHPTYFRLQPFLLASESYLPPKNLSPSKEKEKR